MTAFACGCEVIGEYATTILGMTGPSVVVTEYKAPPEWSFPSRMVSGEIVRPPKRPAILALTPSSAFVIPEDSDEECYSAGSVRRHGSRSLT